MNIKFFKTKLIFKKPKKSDFLIFDERSLVYLGFFLKDNFEIYYVRGELINIYNLVYTIINNGLTNLRENYKLNYFKFVDPKFVITAIDENHHFFLLKDKYNKPKYISFQRGLRNPNFLPLLRKIKKNKPKIKFKTDFSFVLGSNDKYLMQRYIKGKFYVSGSILNNVFPIKKIANDQKLNEITFISSKKYISSKDFSEHIDFNLFSYLIDYCQKKNIKLSYISKSSLEKKNKINEIFNSRFFKYIPLRNKHEKISNFNSYEKLSNSKLIIFSDTTLGHEFISKGNKGICFNTNFPNEIFCKKYKKYGIYWSKKIEFKKFDKVINKVFNMRQKEWDKKTKKVSSEILKYDYNNKDNILIFKKVFNTSLNKLFKIRSLKK